ncbi:hypothetical protein P8935_07765 [Telmatobacter sp. DSM 110680]|uniref:Uncharacterized protein n=1 Tax=Telmatobacter sp. DSM 110680 TaxID=3036704 RepID=A0AAU7DQ66_9BACT
MRISQVGIGTAGLASACALCFVAADIGGVGPCGGNGLIFLLAGMALGLATCVSLLVLVGMVGFRTFQSGRDRTPIKPA